MSGGSKAYDKIDDEAEDSEGHEDSAYNHNRLRILFRLWVLERHPTDYAENCEDRGDVATNREENEQGDVGVGKETFQPGQLSGWFGFILITTGQVAPPN